MEANKETFKPQVTVNFFGANQFRAARISVTNEFSSPTNLEWIPFPSGITAYDDLPESFFAMCDERLAFHMQEAA